MHKISILKREDAFGILKITIKFLLFPEASAQMRRTLMDPPPFHYQAKVVNTKSRPHRSRSLPPTRAAISQQ